MAYAECGNNHGSCLHQDENILVFFRPQRTGNAGTEPA
jgi:hypothetical protein